ncbi:MAG TPA: carbohydrate-binding family 9-like protein, partial [Verrucomicrobiae bacterium]|nr:carbohydrate-binding family 9-like protein [Verrucomicrobiae bacterium]
FQDIEGSAKPKPRFRTRAKMLWDDTYFYVAAELQEPHVWGMVTNHDAVIFQDPDFEVFIDPDGDRHNYYEFEMNALNTTWDLLLKKPYIDGGPALNEWEIAGLKTAVHMTGTINHAVDQDQGWSVEIAFPWKALAEYSMQRSPPVEGDLWRVDFSRVEWQIEIKNGRYEKVRGKKEDNWVWSPAGIIDMHRPEKWGYVKFTRSEAAQQFTAPLDFNAAALIDFYYLQKEFRSRNKHWAPTLTELYSAFPPRFRGLTIDFHPTAKGYEANVHEEPGLHIREDGLLWRP